MNTSDIITYCHSVLPRGLKNTVTQVEPTDILLVFHFHMYIAYG